MSSKISTKNTLFLMLAILLGMFKPAKAQAPIYGNEWIVPGIVHIKIPVSKDGIYRITYFELQKYFADNNVNLKDLHTDSLRLFTKGKQVPMYVSNDLDHRLGLGDFIEFVGHKNDGWLDTGLYDKPSYMRHPYLSMISDTNYYFLTIRSSGTPLRYKDHIYFGTGTPTKLFHRAKTLFLQDKYYYTGRSVLVFDKEAYFSEYSPGEGSYGDIFSSNADASKYSHIVSLNTEGLYKGAGAFNPILTSGVIGWSGYYGQVSHHLIWKVAPSLSTPSRYLGDTSFVGQTPVTRKFEINLSDCSNTKTHLFLHGHLLPGIPFALYGHSHTEIEYPKEYNLFDTNAYSYTEDTFAQLRFFEWKNYGNVSTKRPIVFDEENGHRVFANYTQSTHTINYSLPASPKPGKIFIADSNTISYIRERQMNAVIFPDYKKLLNRPNHYLIVAAAKLYQKDGYIDDYAEYRRNRFEVNTFLFDSLADAFTYGVLHPLAIRRFCAFLYNNSPTYKPEYLFIIGRGYELIYNRGIYASQNAIHMDRNFVPTFGNPASDNMFTSGLGGTKLEPAIKIGRLSADNQLDIRNYLEKVRAYEEPANQYQEWQKYVMHLGGGATDGQARIISDHLAKLGNYVRKDPFAGQVVSYSRTAVSSVDAGLTLSMIERITRGVSLVTFLGHGSSQVTDIDLGDVTKYSNLYKYPFFYFNGCQIGNPCKPLPITQMPFPELLMKGQNKGGIAFIAQTNLSELYTVASQMEAFYKVFFDTSIKPRTIGDVMQKHIANWQIPASDLNRIHCRQLFLQGDPALQVNIASKPDLAVTQSSIFIDPPDAHALSDSFRVGIVVYNYGRGVNQPFNIKLTRTYPNGVVKRFFNKEFKTSGFMDTAFVTIYSKDPETEGDNVFEVEINGDQRFDEYTFTNNNCSASKRLEGNGVNLVVPRRFEIIGEDSVMLMAQGANLLREEAYHFALDTTPWFNSPIKIENDQNHPIYGRVFGTTTLPLLVKKDTQPYFWRARVQGPSGSGGSWKMGSFTYIKKHLPGWMQNHSWQYIAPTSYNLRPGLKVDTAKHTFSFDKLVKSIYIDAWYQHTTNLGVKEGGFGAQDLNYGVCNTGLVCIPWSGTKLLREPINKSILSPKCANGRLWETFGNNGINYMLYYSFDFRNAQDRTDFVTFVNALPDSNYVTCYSSSELHADYIDAPVRAAMNKLGLSYMDTTAFRRVDASYVAVGKKGWKPGMGQENIAFNDSVRLSGKMYGVDYQGSMLSEKIGPTTEFDKVYFNPKKTIDTGLKETDVLNINVWGSNIDGGKELLFYGKTISPIDISGIDTKKYPFIELESDFIDLGKHTAPNLINWRVTFNEVPEGTLFPTANLGYKFYNDTLYEGDSMHFVLPFKNISEIPFRDSIYVEYWVQQKITRKPLVSGYKMYRALKPDSVFRFTLDLPTKGLDGPYEMGVSVNPRYRQPEKNLSNNSRIFTYYVTKDRMNPLLDVTFDGQHIINGDIVSANPIIMVQSKDENKFILQTDTQKMELFVMKPGSSSFEKVPMGTEAIFYAANNTDNKARVEYRPKDLPTGTYTLQVQSTDASNNKAGRVEYEITFNVVREQTATHFYPYPNPFTSKMRFVFTLTGTDVPDDIRVKITNAEGRVVKEVNKSQLGNVHIGNNISDWYWDGTDEFGDKLANGVYFYRVIVQHNGQDVKLRQTKGDASFKESVGTIYLMR